MYQTVKATVLNTPSTSPLIETLQNPALYDHPIKAFSIIETHITWVLLTGEYAYKIKKPVNFGFLDFSSLEKRHFFCQEELRLNRRLVPELYLELVTIYGTQDNPSLTQNGNIIEYAIKMQQFQQSALLNEIARDNKLKTEYIDDIAIHLAEFHQQINIADTKSSFGTADDILHWTMENFTHIAPFLDKQTAYNQLDEIKIWSQQRHHDAIHTFEERKTQGFIRECHGDLHLGNMVLLNEKVRFFDCIEFNESLRWIDVISEIAFVFMDLCDRDYSDYAWRLLNIYLHQTGDYNGLKILRYYLVYRAMVRAKVAILRLVQGHLSSAEKKLIQSDYQSYINLSLNFIEKNTIALIITHGVSGSGKSFSTAQLVENLAAIWIRSDIERKRLFDFNAQSDTQSDFQSGVYSNEASEKTYEHLLDLAATAIHSGYTVIIDATFLKQTQRNKFENFAEQLNIPFIILDFYADESVLLDRIKQRRRAEYDPSEADKNVLLAQLKNQQTLSDKENSYAIPINMNHPLNINNLLNQLNNQIKRS